MATTDPTTKTQRSRADVRREYGHPWPWQSKRILEREYIDEDRTAEELGRDWACHPNTVCEAARSFGLSKEGCR